VTRSNAAWPRPIRAALVLALSLALGLVPALAPVPVAAARPDLTLIGATTYDVLPDEGRVAVTTRLRATNHLRDTVARRFFFRVAFLSVLPGSSNFRISGGNGSPKVTVRSESEAVTVLRIDLGANLAAGRSTSLTLTFDLRDIGGEPDRRVRISPSLVTFDAWAFATPDTPGASVDVRFPTGYNVTIGRGPLAGPEPEPEPSGHERWSSGTIATPLEFVADVDADRPTEYVETSRSVPLTNGDAEVLIRAWPDDTAWRDRVGSLIERALPILEREIGLPWPVDGPLAVHEALVRGAGGFAGLFDPAGRQIEIAYAAPDVVVLHELAHAWFNGRLVADRWAAEAFASYYADVAALELGLEPLAPVPPDAAVERIPLNAWGPSGTESAAAETYAYSASLDLARAIAQRAGPESLRHVWALAAQGIGAYRSDVPTEEPPAGPPDWRGLLDLLEDETAEDFDDLWRTWVARPEDLTALTARLAAREAYASSVALAGEWRLSPTIRAAMRAWRFDLAGELLVAADAVHAQRVTLESSATAAGLALPDTLRTAFEGPDGPAAAAAEASVEQATLEAIIAARSAKPTEGGIVEQLVNGIGLLTEQPEVQLAAATAALAAGDLETAYLAAGEAEDAWSNAGSVGRSRILSTVLLLVALALFAGLVRQALRRRSAAPG
jgi:hypothetical protein